MGVGGARWLELQAERPALGGTGQRTAARASSRAAPEPHEHARPAGGRTHEAALHELAPTRRSPDPRRLNRSLSATTDSASASLPAMARIWEPRSPCAARATAASASGHVDCCRPCGRARRGGGRAGRAGLAPRRCCAAHKLRLCCAPAGRRCTAVAACLRPAVTTAAVAAAGPPARAPCPPARTARPGAGTAARRTGTAPCR